MSLLERKDRMKAITTATKICRMNEVVFNQKYKDFKKNPPTSLPISDDDFYKILKK